MGSGGGSGGGGDGFCPNRHGTAHADFPDGRFGLSVEKYWIGFNIYTLQLQRDPVCKGRL